MIGVCNYFWTILNQNTNFFLIIFHFKFQIAAIALSSCIQSFSVILITFFFNYFFVVCFSLSAVWNFFYFYFFVVWEAIYCLCAWLNVWQSIYLSISVCFHVIVPYGFMFAFWGCGKLIPADDCFCFYFSLSTKTMTEIDIKYETKASTKKKKRN